MDDTDWPITIFNVDDLEVAVYVRGDPEAPLALCLHGFPDSPTTWRHLIPELLRIGYRVAAPFIRGAWPTNSDDEHRAGIAQLGADANRLHEALAADSRAVIIGHDWGASAAYSAA